MKSYVEFLELPTRLNRQTTVLQVLSVNHGDDLGQICWYGRWQQYVFEPAEGTVFSVGCMNDISARITALMAARNDRENLK